MDQKLRLLITAKDQTKQALGRVRSGLASIKKSVFSLKGAFISLGAGIALRSIATTTSNFEDLRDSLASVAGGAEQGAQAFKFINDFALRSQFSVEALTTSFITLKASGIEPTEELFRVFTDTAAVTTDQLGTLEALTRVFSRGVQGGLGLEELNQIADRGVPVFRILEEQLGITRLEIAKFGQTTKGAKKILAALEVGLGTAFTGATQQKLDNLSTSSSNLGIAFRNTLDQIGEGGFRGGLTDLNNELSKTLVELEPLATFLGKGLKIALNGITKALQILNKAVSEAYEIYVDLRDLLGIPIPKTPVITIDKGQIEDANKEIKKQKNLIEKIHEALKGQVSKRLEEMDTMWDSMHETIAEGVVTGINKMSRGLAEALVLGKDLKETMQKLAQEVLINLIAKTIEYIALKAIQKFIDIEILDTEVEKDNMIRKQNTNLKRQIALQMILNAIGGGGGGGIPFMANGGTVSKGNPVVVGERGPELFVPNSTGQIQQNARGTGGGSVVVNFNVNTIDSRGFDEALYQNRGTITAIINNAVNEKGRRELI